MLPCSFHAMVVGSPRSLPQAEQCKWPEGSKKQPLAEGGGEAAPKKRDVKWPWRFSRAGIGGKEGIILSGRNLVSKSTEGRMGMMCGDRDTSKASGPWSLRKE